MGWNRKRLLTASWQPWRYNYQGEAVTTETAEARSCVPESWGGSHGLPVPKSAYMVSVDIKQHWTWWSVYQSSGAVWKSKWPSWAPQTLIVLTVCVDVKQHWTWTAETKKSPTKKRRKSKALSMKKMKNKFLKSGVGGGVGGGVGWVICLGHDAGWSECERQNFKLEDCSRGKKKKLRIYLIHTII